MSPTISPGESKAQEIDRGLIAYEQMRAHERVWRRNLILIWGLPPLLLLGAISCLIVIDPRPFASGLSRWLGAGQFIVVVAFSIWSVRSRQARYRRNVAIVRALEAKYGSDLPWLEVERQAAAIAEIQREAALAGAHVSPESGS